MMTIAPKTRMSPWMTGKSTVEDGLHEQGTEARNLEHNLDDHRPADQEADVDPKER